MLVANVPLFTIITRIGNGLGALLVSWDNDLRALRLNLDTHDDTDITELKQMRLRKLSYIHTSAVMLILVQCLLEGNTSVTTKAQDVIAIAIMQCFASHLHTCRIRAPEIVLYINGHFQFHDMYNIDKNNNPLGPKQKKGKSFTETLNKLFAQVFVVTGLTFPAAVSAVHWIDPCRASLPGYFLLNDCSNGNTEDSTGLLGALMIIKGVIVKGSIFLFNQWIWQFGVNASVFVISGLLALCTRAINSHLDTYWEIYKTAKITAYQKIIAFRQIQVLVCLANYICQHGALVSLIMAAISCTSAGFAMLIRMPLLPETAFLTFVFLSCFINGVMILLVCLSGMVSVYRSSNEILRKATAKRTAQIGGNCLDRKVLERFWKSCPLMKIKFGQSNFVEELTPLNSLNFALEVTVQFLLVKS